MVVAAGATITGNTGQVGVSPSGAPYAAAIIVDIPANASVTIQLQVTSNGVSMYWGSGSWRMEVLTAGEY